MKAALHTYEVGLKKLSSTNNDTAWTNEQKHSRSRTVGLLVFGARWPFIGCHDPGVQMGGFLLTVTTSPHLVSLATGA
jgi:hypothetical protein